jgi:N-acetyl-anhydromuramyl-L-alanine amidase AmpD
MALVIDNRSFRSPNHSARTEDIRALVVHSGDGSRQSDLSWLCNPVSKVSAHYYVCRDGTVYQMVDDNRVAWHAGDSLLAGIRDWNEFSASIELEHTKRKHLTYPDVQRRSLFALCRDLIARYDITPAFVQTHRNITKHRITNKRDDPRDWPEPAFRAWVTTLYPPRILRYRAKTCAPVFQDRRPDALIAGSIEAGDVEEFDDLTAGWLHMRSGLGFCPLGCMEMEL